MSIKAGNLPASTIDNTDYLLITEGEAPKRVSYTSMKNDILGTETLTTTAQTPKGAINEVKGLADANTASLLDLTQKGVVYKTMPISFDVTKISTWTENGIYLTNTSGVTDLPTGWAQGRHVVVVFNPGNSIYGMQFIAPYQGASGQFKKIAFRNGIVDGSLWKELGLPDQITTLWTGSTSTLGNITLASSINAGYDELIIVTGSGTTLMNYTIDLGVKTSSYNTGSTINFSTFSGIGSFQYVNDTTLNLITAPQVIRSIKGVMRSGY